MPSFDSKRLYSALLNTGLQSKDPALYQVIYQLINVMVGAQNSISSLSGSSGDTNVTEINNTYQIITGSKTGGAAQNRIVPGPQGVKGDTGASGPSLPGPLGIIKHYVETYPRYVPFQGNQGNQGTTGAQGPLGSFINIRNYEIYKRTIQLFQGSSSSNSSGSYQYLGSQTASASASLNFTSLISSLYNKYIFDLENIILATDNVDLLMRTSTDNGATFDNGAGNYGYASYLNNTGAFSTNGVSSASATSVRLIPDADNAAGSGSICGSIELINPLNTTVYKHVNYHLSYKNNDNQFYNLTGSGWRLATADIDAVQFLASTGNITSGTIRMFGVKNS
jgi:hypothetical protein